MDTIDKILNLMDNAGVTAYQLSQDAGISNGLITQWRQHKQNPSIKNVKKVAQYFNVPWETLLDDDRNLSINETFDRFKISSENQQDIFREYFNKTEATYINKMRCLNYKGVQKVLTYIDDLYGNSEYRADINKVEK